MAGDDALVITSTVLEARCAEPTCAQEPLVYDLKGAVRSIQLAVPGMRVVTLVVEESSIVKADGVRPASRGVVVSSRASITCLLAFRSCSLAKDSSSVQDMGGESIIVCVTGQAR